MLLPTFHLCVASVSIYIHVLIYRFSLLSSCPQVALVQIAIPRTDSPPELKDDIAKIIGRINSTFGGASHATPMPRHTQLENYFEGNGPVCVPFLLLRAVFAFVSVCMHAFVWDLEVS